MPAHFHDTVASLPALLWRIPSTEEKNQDTSFVFGQEIAQA
jgi:hypothetical protein